ncbi:hypothetical protein B0T10DRAFT_568536 [Thelonectria olida]|uniref:Uncharacterized protein n=1 Tax=Thelonectria olida TaxID=1576542 RepID=A0A9P9AI86_9HYPO|nr:hypothetical protein B0T10DRAFT_568536 [Thelonectria olida]
MESREYRQSSWSSFLAPFTGALGWTQEEVTVFLVNLRKELTDPKIHAYWPIVSVYGQKPYT